MKKELQTYTKTLPLAVHSTSNIKSPLEALIASTIAISFGSLLLEAFDDKLSITHCSSFLSFQGNITNEELQCIAKVIFRQYQVVTEGKQ